MKFLTGWAWHHTVPCRENEMDCWLPTPAKNSTQDLTLLFLSPTTRFFLWSLTFQSRRSQLLLCHNLWLPSQQQKLHFPLEELIFSLVGASDGLDITRNLSLVFWKCHGEMGLKASWPRFNFIFCQIFGIFDDFSKWSALNALQNF